MNNELLAPKLAKQYKDHTIQNAVENMSSEYLPYNARSVHTQPIRQYTYTLQILDEETGQVIDTLTGKVLNGGVKLDSSSLIRRTMTLDMILDEDVMPRTGSLIWFKKIAKLYIGLKDFSQTNTVVNFLAGTYWIDSTSISIDQATRSLSVSLSDKMTKYDTFKLENTLILNIDTPITEAIRQTMEFMGEKSFGIMEECLEEEVIPYTMTYSAGDNAIDIITDLRDMYMDYVCGYNLRGEFEFRKLKIQKEDEVADAKWRFDSTVEDRTDLTTSFGEDYNLKDIRNRVKILGATSEKTGLMASAEVRLTDPASPFNVYAIGERTTVEVADNCYTDEQCRALGRYRLQSSSTFQEKCSINTVPIFILDAFDILDVVNPVTKKLYRYQLQTFDYNLSIDSAMTITANKLYFVTLEYGEEMIPVVEAIIRGIKNWGWISLSEQRIKDCYNITGSGEATMTVLFTDNGYGDTQASVTSYGTTKNQTMLIDLADFANLKMTDENGAVTGKSSGDYTDRVLGHEIVHGVMNDYFGHSMAIMLPIWFKEGFSELIHGAKERYLSCYARMDLEEKKKTIIDRARQLLEGEWQGSSEDYTVSYLIAIAIYRIQAAKGQWSNTFVRLRGQENIGINFLYKLLPIADDNNGVIELVLQEMENMTDIWTALEDKEDLDTCSIGGIHMMNLYGIPLTAESVFNNSDAEVESLGFKIKYEK